MSQNTLTHLAFCIPTEDAREFAGLPQKTRDRVNWLLDIMQAIAACSRGRVALCGQFAAAHQPPLHVNSIYNVWKKFSESADWRHLIDKRHTSEFWKRDATKRVGLPPAFVQDWKTRCEDNGRAFKPAWRILIKDWKAWRTGDQTKAVPGYDRCPEPEPNKRIPRGWGYSNLLQYTPDDVELAASGLGREAARKLLPRLLTTRVGSYPFREIQFDDMWHNFLVNVAGQKNACRLLEFGAVDTFSTYIFNPGLKPRLRNMDTGRMEILNERDFHLYVINWILDNGIHPDGTIFQVENGTARIGGEFGKKLMRWFPTLKIETGGMSGAPAFPGAYQERAKGNPNSKSLKEGLGKLIQNQLAHLPGQIGINRDTVPGGHFGRDRENDTLLAIAAQLPQLRESLQFGFLALKDAVYAVNEIYGLLNLRDDHQIEGWADVGGVVDMFRFSQQSDDWRPLSDVSKLPPDEQFMLSTVLKMNPELKDRRVLSPAQFLLAHDTRLLKLPDAAIPDLLGPRFGEIAAVLNGIIAFTMPGLGKLRFKALYQDADGFRRRVENGTEVLAHLNPWKPDFLYLSERGTGRYLGKAARDIAHTRGDTDATARAHGRAQADYKDSLHDLVARHGLSRIPHLKANTAAVRAASQPSARDRSLAEAGFDASTMLDAEPEDFTVAQAPYFDPADLL